MLPKPQNPMKHVNNSYNEAVTVLVAAEAPGEPT